MYQPFFVFGVHLKSVNKITALGTATAHCNHVGQSSIFVTLLFPPSAVRRLPREQLNLLGSTGEVAYYRILDSELLRIPPCLSH